MVFALNSDGRPGVAGKDAFPTNPEAKTLRHAARLGARSAVVNGDGVRLRTQCPVGGHCDTEIKLRLHGRRIASTHYQQTPDTFHRARLTPRGHPARSLRRQLSNLKIVVEVDRSRERATARSAVGA